MIVRAYDGTHEPGAYRVLVDRLWPRGVSKEAAALDEWSTDVAPTSDLRRWYGHDPAKFPEFQRRYRDELERAPASDVVDHLVAIAADRPVALVTATRDVEHSGATVLRELLLERLGAP
jgi:uncharacterized protein YeaO (DUF488 family)